MSPGGKLKINLAGQATKALHKHLESYSFPGVELSELRIFEKLMIGIIFSELCAFSIEFTQFLQFHFQEPSEVPRLFPKAL